ncbi:MAG: hypothetical protein NTV51_03920 [Verrucomicrobia bacterium]|nr:hypothetical protein [Verrucomicrobiota bacterium]
MALDAVGEGNLGSLGHNYGHRLKDLIDRLDWNLIGQQRANMVAALRRALAREALLP